MATPCAVCLDDEAPWDVCALPCGHQFHFRCVRHVLSGKCPMCRGDFDVPSLEEAARRRALQELSELSGDIVDLSSERAVLWRDVTPICGGFAEDELLELKLVDRQGRTHAHTNSQAVSVPGDTLHDFVSGSLGGAWPVGGHTQLQLSLKSGLEASGYFARFRRLEGRYYIALGDGCDVEHWPLDDIKHVCRCSDTLRDIVECFELVGDLAVVITTDAVMTSQIRLVHYEGEDVSLLTSLGKLPMTSVLVLRSVAPASLEAIPGALRREAARLTKGQELLVVTHLGHEVAGRCVCLASAADGVPHAVVLEDRDVHWLPLSGPMGARFLHALSCAQGPSALDLGAAVPLSR